MVSDTPHTNPAYDKEISKMRDLLSGMEDTLRRQMAGHAGGFCRYGFAADEGDTPQ